MPRPKWCCQMRLTMHPRRQRVVRAGDPVGQHPPAAGGLRIRGGAGQRAAASRRQHRREAGLDLVARVLRIAALQDEGVARRSADLGHAQGLGQGRGVRLLQRRLLLLPHGQVARRSLRA